MSEEVEEWRPWPRDTAYEVSDLGRVRGPSGRISAGWVETGKGLVVEVRSRRMAVRRMVWQTWCRNDDTAIAYCDGDPSNNRPSNLRAYETPCPVVPEVDLPVVLARYDSGERIEDIAQGYGVSGQTLRNALRRVVRVGDRRRALTAAKAEAKAAAQKAKVAAKYQALGRPKLREMTAEQRWEYDRNRHLRSEFGISMADFRRLWKAQAGKCALCGDPLQEWEQDCERKKDGRHPVVDHCHQSDGSEAVRGILHAKCNAAIGLLDDDPEKARRAARYLERTRHARPMRPGAQQHGLEGL